MLKERVFPLILCALSLVSACDRFHKNFSSIDYQCGLDEASHQGSYVKLLNPDGAELSPQDLETTRSRVLLANGLIQELSSSPKGCVALPSSSGILQVYTLQGLQATRPFAPNRPGIQTVILQPSEPAQAELLCPAQGYFVDKELSFPLRLTGAAGSESSRVRLMARNNLGQESELFFKDYGATLPLTRTALSTEALQDGVFELRLEAQTIHRRWDASVLPENGGALCLLSVLHTPPGVSGDLELGPGLKSFYPKGAIMNWTAAGANSELRVCRESRGADEDQLPGTDQLCEARARCQDPAEFVASPLLRADEAGVFDYFFFAENRAGLKSAVQCKRVLVSDQKPAVDVRWDESIWNRPAAVMSRPVNSFGAQVSLFHPQFTDADLRKNLQCKVDFLLDGIASLPGRDVICLSGRCQGKTMDQYVSCDTTLRASLEKFWSEQRARPVLMRLHVKATDAAQQSTETIRSVWIHPQRWAPESSPSHPVSGYDLGEKRLFPAKDGFVYSKIGESLQRWNESSRTWTDIDLPFRSNYSRLVPTAEGGFFWVGRQETSTQIFERQGDSWQTALTPIDPTPCLTGKTYPHPQGGFVCVGYDRYIQQQKGAWSEVLLPCPSKGEVVLKSGSVLIVCADGRLQQRKAGGGWETLPQSFPDFLWIDEDVDGRIWILRSGGSGYLFEGVWTAVTMPAINYDSFPGFGLTASGQAMFFEYIWDGARRSWKRLEGLPDRNYRSISVGAGKYVLYNSGQLLLWDAGEVTEYPAAWFGIDLVDDTIQPWVFHLRQDGDLWMILPEPRDFSHYYPALFPFHKSNSFGAEVNLFKRANSSRAFNFWVEDSGDITQLISDRGLVRSDATSWKTIWDTQGRDVTNGWRTPQGTYYVLDSKSQELLRYREGESAPTAIDANQNFVFTQAPTGPLVVYSTTARAGWILSDAGERRVTFPLDLPYGVDCREIAGQLILSVPENGSHRYLRFNPATALFERIEASALGLPAHSWFAASRTQLQGNLVLLDSADGLLLVEPGKSNRPLVLPDSLSSFDVRTFLQTGPDEFLVLGMSSGIFRGNGASWQTLLSAEEAQVRFKLQDRAAFYDMRIDAFQRLWVVGEYFRLLEIDL